MRENITMKGIVSILIFLIIFNSPTIMVIGEIIIGPFFVWPFALLVYAIIDYALKAYNLQFDYYERSVNLLSKVINVIFLGIPFLLYGYMSLLMMIINKNPIDLKSEWYGIIILGVLSLGIIPLLFFLLAGPSILVTYAVFSEDSELINDNKVLFWSSIVISTIVTFGLILVVMFVQYYTIKLILYSIGYPDHSESSKSVWFVLAIISVVSYGIYPIYLILTYFLYELVYLDIATSKNNPTKDRINEMSNAIKDLLEG